MTPISQDPSPTLRDSCFFNVVKSECEFTVRRKLPSKLASLPGSPWYLQGKLITYFDPLVWFHSYKDDACVKTRPL